MDVDGDNERRLLDGEGDNDSPVWSPDGSMIAFRRTVPSRQALTRDSKKLLMVVPVSGDRVGKPRVVAEVTTNDVPAWSPDSTRLAWVEFPQRPVTPPQSEPPQRSPGRPLPPRSSEFPGPSSLPPGLHRVSPAPRPEVSFGAPQVEVRPPLDARPPSSLSPPRGTIRWKAVTGTRSGKLTAPEWTDSPPVWTDQDHLVFSVSPIGPSPRKDLIRVRISDGTVTSLGVPVVLPARMPDGQVAGILQDKPGDSRLIVVDPSRKGYQTVTKIRMGYPYRGMTISAFCPD